MRRRLTSLDYWMRTVPYHRAFVRRVILGIQASMSSFWFPHNPKHDECYSPYRRQHRRMDQSSLEIGGDVPSTPIVLRPIHRCGTIGPGTGTVDRTGDDHRMAQALSQRVVRYCLLSIRPKQNYWYAGKSLQQICFVL